MQRVLSWDTEETHGPHWPMLLTHPRTVQPQEDGLTLLRGERGEGILATVLAPPQGSGGNDTRAHRQRDAAPGCHRLACTQTARPDSGALAALQKMTNSKMNREHMIILYNM